MKCLLIMTFIFINGIETAEHKGRQSGTILREDDLDSKAKAWLLMVESGKAEDEHVRKITPKSIFIAPLLSSRSNKCKEGYRHDHLGQCVKVIKLDQKAQLELLLKRLSAMYAEKKPEEEGLPNISSGPLHFSLPISGADTTTDDSGGENTTIENMTTTTTTTTPTPLLSTIEPLNATDEVEYSGSGTLNDTAPEEGSGFEGSGWDSESNGTTETATLISEELDYSETTTEVTSTEVPYTTDLFETATFPATEQTPPSFPPQGGRSPLVVIPETKIAERERQESTRIVFPDTLDGTPNSNGNHQNPNYQLWEPNYEYDLRKLPPQQLWWLPPNWRVDDQQKPAVFKFWSHLPLVHDPSLVGERKPFYPSQSHAEAFQPSTRIPEVYTIQPVRSTHRRGRNYPVRLG